jgi:hypothetical protein
MGEHDRAAHPVGPGGRVLHSRRLGDAPAAERDRLDAPAAVPRGHAHPALRHRLLRLPGDDLGPVRRDDPVTRATFAAYGASLLLFLVFDWWFTFVRPVFTAIGLLDAVGNVVMLVLCILGWRALSARPRPAE